MTGFLRLISVLIGAGGVTAGVILFVQAQPTETYGEVNSVLVGYGIGLLLSGLFWALLGLSVAKAVDSIEALRSTQSESEQAQSQSSTHAEKTGSEKESQSVASTEKAKSKEESESIATFAAIVILIVAFASILVVILSSAG